MDLTELNKVEGKAKSSIFSGIMHSDHSNSVFVMVYNRLSSLSCSLLCFALHTSPCHPSVLMYPLFSVSRLSPLISSSRLSFSFHRLCSCQQYFFLNEQLCHSLMLWSQSHCVSYVACHGSPCTFLDLFLDFSGLHWQDSERGKGLQVGLEHGSLGPWINGMVSAN